MELSLKKVLLSVVILYGMLFLLFLNDYNNIFLYHADSPEYVALAQNLVDHHVFSRDMQEPEIIRTPGYPLLLAVAMAIAGEHYFFYLVVLIQIVLVGGTAYLTYRLGKMVFGSQRLGILVASIYVLLPTTIFYACAGMTETLFTFLLIGAFSLLATSHISYRKAILAGAVISLAILVRPIAILSPLIILPMAMRTQWRNGIWFLAGLLLILAPWVARNYYQGYGVNISYIGAFNLAHGNATKFYAWQNHIDTSTALEDIEREVGDTMQNNPALNAAQVHERVALNHILTNAPVYTWFHLIKTVPFFVASSIKGVALNLQLTKPSERTADLLLQGRMGFILQKLIKELPYTLESLIRVLLTGLLFIGAWRAWKIRNIFLVLLFLLIIQFALLTSPWSDTRFRLPFEPYILLFAFSVFQKDRWPLRQLRKAIDHFK